MNEKALQLLDDAYTRFLMGKINKDRLCKEIKTALEIMPFGERHKHFEVQISNSKGYGEFFGMRIFPAIPDLDSFCDSLVRDDSRDIVKYNDITKRWKNIENWVLEIDGICFDRTRLNFSPKELSALTLHEIGHVIYSDKPVEAFYRAYRETKTRMKISDRAGQKLMYNLYMIPLSIACMQRRWTNGRNEVHTEIVADKTVLELGYGEYLAEALEKIIKNFGTINTSESQQQKEVTSEVEWCARNMDDLTLRKDHLKDELYYKAVRAKSNYLKAISVIILDKMGLKMRERYTGAVVEASMDLLNDPDCLNKYQPFIDVVAGARFNSSLRALESSEQGVIDALRDEISGKVVSAAMESIFNRRKKVKAELPSQFEVDAIAIEVDKITNHHDRVFVLDLIYEVLDRINTFEEVISADPALVKKWQGKINTMKAQLEVLRQATLDKKTFNQGYKFFVKLPDAAAAYEG